MRSNTPPRVEEIEGDDMDEFNDSDLEEVTLEELEARLGNSNYNDDDLDEDEENEEMHQSEVPDESELCFKSHTASVFSCAIHPQRQLAVTGGEDDKAYLWNLETGEVLHTITKHKDTVIEAHFNHDGNYLATGDMAGEIFVHKLKDDEATCDTNAILREVWEYSMGDMVWMRWHRSGNVLIAGSETGEVFIWRIPSGECKILPGFNERCETGELTHDGKKLLTSYSNGIIKLWELKSCTCVMEVNADNPMALNETVVAVACDKENPIYMAGSQDGKILFCTNTGPVAVVEADGAVECVAFSPSDMKVAASGTLTGQIAIWDFSRYSLRSLCENPNPNDGITRLKWIDDYTLVVGTIMGNIYGFDVRTGNRRFTLLGHSSDIYDIHFDSSRNLLLSASDDTTAKVFKIPSN